MANRNDPFFNRLTQLFRSGPAIQRKVKGYDYKNYYDNQLARGNNGHRGPFPFGRESSPFSVLGAYGILDRMARYSEFAEMEYQPEIAAALNIFADETSAGDERGKAFHLFSKNPEVKKALEELFYDILNIDFNIRPWVRNLVKYGDFFLYNEVVPDIGIINVQPIPVNELEREDGFDQNDPYAIRYKWLTRGNRYLENWQVTHMRVLGNDLFLPYGTSILEPARRVWRQLTMMEDSMLLYRVVRSPERRVFYIDVGNVAPNDVPSYMEAVKETLKSRNQLDKSTGQMDARYNPLDIESDYFIPVRGGTSGTKIETLPGGQNATAVDDVKYLQQKMFAALQVPKPFLNFDENLCFVGKTAVSLLSGKSKTIEDLASEFDLAKQNNATLPENYAYSVTSEGNVVSGKIINAWKTKEVNEVCKVTLDNGETIESTLSHPYMLRDGTYLRADELKNGTSLMPLYRKISSKKTKHQLEGYELFLNNENSKWTYTHRMVKANENLETHPSHLTEAISVVHHKNFDKLNNDPSNLLVIGRNCHHQIHVDGATTNLVCEENRDRLRTLWNVPESSLRSAHKQGVIDAWKDAKQASSRRNAIATTNRVCGKIDIMKKKLKETQMSKVPSYSGLCEYVSNNINATASTAKLHYGCSFPQLRSIIKSAGFNDWVVFYKSIHNNSLPSGRDSRKILLNKLPKDFISIANACKSIEHFCNETNISRIAFKKFLTDNNEDYTTWFKTNLIRHSKSIGKFYNHKVISVEIIKYEQPVPVYDLTIENKDNTHNFALEAGVFVHNSAKASLAQQDVRFSRTISVLQRVIISELNKMAMVHLYSKGFDGEDLLAFELRLSNPSTVAMQQKLEAMSTKFDIAGKAKETKLVDEDWIQRKILELTEDDIIKISSGIRRDKIREVEIEAIAVAENLPQKNTVTDPFDPSGYVMPGGDVKKNPPVGGTTMVTDVPTNQISNIQNAAAAGVAIAGNPGAKAKSPTSGVPISANPFTTRQRHNDRRLVGMGGRDNLQNPDFANMLSATNKHMTDINDKHSLTKLSEKTLGRLDTTDINLDEFRAPPLVTSEVKQLKQSLDAHFEKVGGRKKKIIITENDVNLSKLDEEDDGRLFELTMSGDNIIVEATSKNDDDGLLDDLLNDE
jgi:hypothetical protein